MTGYGDSASVAAAPGSPMPLYVREADRLGHHYIGCEHMLLGMLADEDGIAAQVLAAHGITLEAARRHTDEIGRDVGKSSMHKRHSPRATVVRTLARVEAERLDHTDPPDDAHVLLAIITDRESVPMNMFAGLGVDVVALRADLLDALRVPPAARDTYIRQRDAYEWARRSREAGPDQ